MNILHSSPVHMYEGHSRMYTGNGIVGFKEYTFSNLAHSARDSLMWLYPFKPHQQWTFCFSMCSPTLAIMGLITFSFSDFSLHFFDYQRYWVTFHVCMGLKISFSLRLHVHILCSSFGLQFLDWFVSVLYIFWMPVLSLYIDIHMYMHICIRNIKYICVYVQMCVYIYK